MSEDSIEGISFLSSLASFSERNSLSVRYNSMYVLTFTGDELSKVFLNSFPLASISIVKETCLRSVGLIKSPSGVLNT